MDSPSVDVQAVLRADAQAGYQLASLVALPAYVTFALVRKRGLTLNRTLRATWIAGVVGAGAGAGYGWYESRRGDNYLRDRHIGLSYDARRIRSDDHSIIGAVLFAVITPALFWRSARAAHLILGGAGVGSSIGLATCAYRGLTNPQPASNHTVPSPAPLADQSVSVGRNGSGVR